MTGAATSSHTRGEGLVHEALLYRTEDELRDALRRFLAEAAAADEPVLVALPGPTLDTVRAELGAAAPDARFQDIAEVGRNPGRLFPMIQRWVEEHEEVPAGRVRVACEAIWPGRSQPERVECLRQEALLNALMADVPATIMCSYDAERLDSQTLEGAELTHPTLVESGRRRPSASYSAEDQIALAERWPLEDPVAPIVEHLLQSSLSSMRRAIAQDALVAELPPERREDLVLAVNEAIINAVQHGAAECAASVWHDGRGVVAEVRTASRIEDPRVGRHCPPPEADSGRGLWLINQVCNLVELRTGEGGTVLRMHMHDR